MTSVPTVLVTGCAGYIGSVLVDYLIGGGFKVIGVDNLRYDNAASIMAYLGHPHFEFHKIDVQDWLKVTKLAERADSVVALAALVGAPACDKDDRSNEYAHSVNTWAIGALVKGLSPYQRIVYPNTNSGYGQTDGTREVTEEDPMNPISTYGWTKCAGEYAVLNHPRGVSLRLATVFGASPRQRMDLMVNDFTQQLWQIKEARDSSRKFKIFEPHFKRNFVHIRDVCRAFRFAIWNPKMSGAYNVGLPTANLTKMELAHKVCDTIGLSREAVIVGKGTDPDKRNYLVSNKKLLDTGFKFEHTLEEGVNEIVQVCQMFPEKARAGMRNA